MAGRVTWIPSHTERQVRYGSILTCSQVGPLAAASNLTLGRYALPEIIELAHVEKATALKTAPPRSWKYQV
jgi:hypothetical protein